MISPLRMKVVRIDEEKNWYWLDSLTIYVQKTKEKQDRSVQTNSYLLGTLCFHHSVIGGNVVIS